MDLSNMTMTSIYLKNQLLSILYERIIDLQVLNLKILMAVAMLHLLQRLTRVS